MDSSPPGSSSLGFSRQEHWSGLPFPSPMHESEKWKWSRSVVSILSDPMDCSLPASSVHGISRQEYWSGVPLPSPADRQVLWRTAQDGFSVAQSCPSLYDPMGCSVPGFLALHYLPEFAQTCVHWVSVMPSNHLSLCRSLLLLLLVFPSIKVRDFYRPKWAGTRKLYWVFAGWLEQGFYMKWKSILEQVG